MDNQKEFDHSKEHSVVVVWRKNKKKIVKVVGVLGGICTFLLMLKGGKYFLNASALKRWYKKASLDELKTFRNNIHSEALNYTVNDEYRATLWESLPIIDKRIHEMESAGKVTQWSSYPREHGHGLYKRD